MKHPDPKKHQQISFIKSAIRILGYAFLFFDIEFYKEYIKNHVLQLSIWLLKAKT